MLSTNIMWIFLSTIILSAGPIEVDVTTLDGLSETGAIVGLTVDEMVLEKDGRKTRYEVKNLRHVVPKAKPATADHKPSVWIELIDHSLIHATGFTVSQGKATATLVGGGHIKVRTRSIGSVRFRKQDQDIAQQWQDIRNEKSEGDAIVVRQQVDIKSSTPEKSTQSKKTKAVLNYLEGVLYDVTDKVVQFEYDGDRGDVPRRKVEGLIYFHPARRELPSSVCQVADRTGSIWNVKSIELSEDQLHLVSTAGVEHSLPLARARKLDFSVGKIVFLSDVTPNRAEWKPYIGLVHSSGRAVQLFGYRRDQNLVGNPLRLDGKSYEKGLALHSRSVLVYRLPGKFRHFRAIAGIDDSVGGRGHVRLEIYGDKEKLLERIITAKDAPFPLDVDITGVVRLKILVDYGDELDIGDHLDLCNARITK